MLAIRLTTHGFEEAAVLPVVVTDSRTARDSRFVEILGHYNPRTKPETLKLDRERLDALDEGRRAAVRHGPHARGAHAAAPPDGRARREQPAS